MKNKGTIATHGPNCWYNVFVSFRGLDTRHTFTSDLYDALRRTGFNTFMDVEGLQSGDQISLSLVKAIQESRISIVVFSQNYASSSWYLDELVYKVALSDVRHQRNSYGEAMIKHENRFGNESEKVQKWRTALFEVANLKGWHFETGYEYEFIKRIVEMTIAKSHREQLDVGEHIFGHQSRIEELISLLDIESRNTVCMVGIHGTGGIGKKTLAKALYNSIVDQFECAIFLEGVRETSNNVGLVQLQGAFPSKLLEGKIIKLGSVDEGTARLKDRLHHRRVLLVLDDVDSEEQLEKLAGKCNWFGSGSRIIITTRDKHVQNVHEVEYASLDSPPPRNQARRTSTPQFAIRSPPSLAADASNCIPSHSQTSMAMAMRNNHNKYLPEPIILEILLRLPVKSLLRFRCVSKSWLSLISDPNFAKLHFELSAAPTHRFLCYQGSATRVRSIDPDTLFHDDPAMVSLVLPLPTTSHLRIRGSCRGFIMLQDYWNFILWNPTTRVHKLIYYSHIASSVNDVYSFLDDALLYGFGYDASKDDYLIVIAWSDNNGENHFEYFSLRTNSWKKFEVTLPDPHMDPAFSPGFFLNGAIHWFAPTHGECTILAFDLITRKFSEIPLPVPIAEDVEYSCLQLLGGCLSMSFRTCDKKIEIWLMKEYKEQSSWTMYEIFDSHFVPIYFTKGGEIIGFDGNGGLMKYTDKGELLEYCAYGHYRFEDTMYTESLLSLPSGPGEAGEDDQQ